MAVKLRLARRGNTHRPFYHIVAADERSRRDGRFIEQVGVFDPLGEQQLAVDEEKVAKWLQSGAQLSTAVKKLLKRAGATSAASAA